MVRIKTGSGSRRCHLVIKKRERPVRCRCGIKTGAALGSRKVLRPPKRDQFALIYKPVWTFRLSCSSCFRALTDPRARATLFGARVVSSVGRAVVSKTTGRRFEPCTARHYRSPSRTGFFHSRIFVSNPKTPKSPQQCHNWLKRLVFQAVFWIYSLEIIK
jgi:hypothetical protein